MYVIKQRSVEAMNDARKLLFTHKSKQTDNIPPPEAALNQHTVYDAQRTRFYNHMSLPNPADWGWTKPESWKPLWITLPDASDTYRESLHHADAKRDVKEDANAEK